MQREKNNRIICRTLSNIRREISQVEQCFTTQEVTNILKAIERVEKERGCNS